MENLPHFRGYTEFIYSARYVSRWDSAVLWLSVSVCPHTHISRTTCPTSQNFLCLLCYLWPWRRCNTLGISVFWSVDHTAGKSMDRRCEKRRILQVTHQGVAPDRGQSLISAVALLVGISCPTLSALKPKIGFGLSEAASYIPLHFDAIMLL